MRCGGSMAWPRASVYGVVCENVGWGDRARRGQVTTVERRRRRVMGWVGKGDVKRSKEAGKRSDGSGLFWFTPA